jgi:hypothetical protein
MNSATIRQLFAISFFVIALVYLVPELQAAGDDDRSMDNAMLLMVAGQSRMYEGYDPVAAAAPLGTVPLAQGASRAQINEHQQLADYYRQFASKLPQDSPARQNFENKANAHQTQAQILENARQQFFRQRRSFGGRVRSLGRALATPVAKLSRSVVQGGRWTFRGLGNVGDTIFVVARDELVSRAKQIIRDKVQMLTDLGRGRIDAVVARLAHKAGWPVAELVREMVLNPAAERLEGLLKRNVDQLLGERSENETENETEEDSAEVTGTDVEHDTDWSTVDEEGDTDYDTEETTSIENDVDDSPTDKDTPDESEAPVGGERIYDVHDWFSATSCRRFAGQMPGWMENTTASAYAWGKTQFLGCNWTSDLRESEYGCDVNGNNCALMPGRVEIEIYAHPTIADAQEGFRGYTTNCSQDAACVVDLTRLITAYAEPDEAYGGELAYFTRLITIKDNVIISLWWGGAQYESDVFGLLSSAEALIDPLQR